jgi:hypothetical protein
MADEPTRAPSARLIVTRCRNHRHGAERTDVFDAAFPTLLLLADDPSILDEIVAVDIGPARMRLERSKGVIHHEGRHTDPLFRLMVGESHALEAQVYDAPESLTDADVVVSLDDGIRRRSVIVVPERVPDPGSASLETEIETIDGKPILLIKSEAPLELIRQRIVDGRFVETASQLQPGKNVVPIEPAFADYLGFCVTSRDLSGAIEHKHAIFGRFGLGSGRHLLDAAGRLHHPKENEPYAYRSFVVAVADDDPRTLETIAREAERLGADETELFLSAKRKAENERPPSPFRHGKARTVRTFGKKTDRLDPNDILVLDPGDDPPDEGACSFLLFLDSDSPEWTTRLAAAAEAAAKFPNARLIDRSWLDATQGSLGESEVLEYGISVSVPGGALRIDAAEEPEIAALRLRRAVVRAKGRTLVPGPCAECPDERRIRCDAITPFPQPLAKDGRRHVLVEGTCRSDRDGTTSASSAHSPKGEGTKP